jgi:hypothetical protein
VGRRADRYAGVKIQMDVSMSSRGCLRVIYRYGSMVLGIRYVNIIVVENTYMKVRPEAQEG